MTFSERDIQKLFRELEKHCNVQVTSRKSISEESIRDSFLVSTGSLLAGLARMDTHYLATEYGVVNLKQKSVRERAEAIISIAHPKFRDDLLKEALRMGLM